MLIADLNTDSDSVCEGSNPSSAASPEGLESSGFFFIYQCFTELLLTFSLKKAA